MDIKIIKTAVTAKSRQINAKWSLSSTVIGNYEMLLEELEKQARADMIKGEKLMESGWHRIRLTSGTKIDSEWMQANITGLVRQFGDNFYFKNEMDASKFALKWA